MKTSNWLEIGPCIHKRVNQTNLRESSINEYAAFHRYPSSIMNDSKVAKTLKKTMIPAQLWKSSNIKTTSAQ